MQYLDDIQSPADLKKLELAQLPELAIEMRQALLETLNGCGGHLGANLGTVELAIALHYVFNAPSDPIIWDVGHQAYPHKMLTGRKHLLHTIRQKSGLAPFPRLDESPFDAFGVGHSSTSISAALGYALAHQHQQQASKPVAVIGDGAMTAGMAFEALNHAGDLKANMLVVLNDNDMSISGNVGALSNYFARILSSKLYCNMRQGSKRVLNRMPPIKAIAKKTEEHLKGLVVPGTLFEELGFNYIGPIDGHDVHALIRCFNNVKSVPGPQLIHAITQKGKGFAPAEADPIKFHGVSKGFYQPYAKCNPDLSHNAQQADTKTTPVAKKAPPTYSQIFGEWLCQTAEQEPAVMGITPAMCEGSGMVEFAQKFPTRYFDVGIAEQHSVTLAAGMACGQLKPVVAIYSTFLQRAYDQLIHDVALQNLPVLFALDRAGLVGGDGPTHCGNFDLSYLRCIPNMIVMTPSDADECRHLLTTGLKAGVPAAVRYPRGAAPAAPTMDAKVLPIGQSRTIRQGQEIAILNFGSLLTEALEVAQSLNASLVDMRFVKPLDEAIIHHMTQSHALLVTLEENAVKGGAGSAVNEYLMAQSLNIPVLNIGIPDFFVEHALPQEMRHSCGLDVSGIQQQIMEKVSSHPCLNKLSALKSHSTVHS